MPFFDFLKPKPKLAPGSNIPESVMSEAAVAFSQFMESRGHKVILSFVANTNSMLQTFDSNALHLVELCPFDDVRLGDILVWNRPGVGRIAHRAYEKRPGGWWCKGDNNSSVDPDLATATNFVGRVCGLLYAQKTAKTDT